MTISKVMSLIDEEKIKAIGGLYKIDKANTKITGEFILKVFVHGALQGIPMSLRSIETLVQDNKDLASNLKSKDDKKKKADHSSIGKRLSSANIDFFKAIYEDIADKYHNKFGSKKDFHIFDSTILTISNKLLKNGLNLGGFANDSHTK
jgi:hypothetical protein